METKKTNKPGMLEFTTINIDGELEEWSFDSVEAFRKECYTEKAYLPAFDDPVASMTFCGVKMHVKTFNDLTALFGF